MLSLSVLFSACESMSSFYKVAGKSLLLRNHWQRKSCCCLFFFFFFFWLEINHLLLCVWFPGSWLELPRQTLNTAPLFSPQEQCLNVESTPILTEDAQSWIWVEVGISDALRRGTRRPHMACSPPASFKEALGP